MNSLVRYPAKCFEAEHCQGVDLALLSDVQHPADAKAIERASPVSAPRHLAHAGGIAATLRQRGVDIGRGAGLDWVQTQIGVRSNGVAENC